MESELERFLTVFRQKRGHRQPLAQGGNEDPLCLAGTSLGNQLHLALSNRKGCWSALTLLWCEGPAVTFPSSGSAGLNAEQGLCWSPTDATECQGYQARWEWRVLEGKSPSGMHSIVEAKFYTDKGTRRGSPDILSCGDGRDSPSRLVPGLLVKRALERQTTLTTPTTIPSALTPAWVLPLEETEAQRG